MSEVVGAPFLERVIKKKKKKATLPNVNGDHLWVVAYG